MMLVVYTVADQWSCTLALYGMRHVSAAQDTYKVSYVRRFCSLFRSFELTRSLRLSTTATPHSSVPLFQADQHPNFTRIDTIEPDSTVPPLQIYQNHYSHSKSTITAPRTNLE